jgi:Zn-dependent protease
LEHYTIRPDGIIPPDMLGLSLPSLLARAVTLVVALTTHEFAHAWSAVRLGDDTPRLQGRLTLNPLVHLDPLGSLMLLVAGFGWARPVPVDPYAVTRRTPAGMMLVAASGPLANLLLAILAAIPFRLGLQAGMLPTWFSTFLLEFMFINLVLLLLNLIPLFPLDGEKVAAYLLPPGGQALLARIRPYGPMILLALIILGQFARIDVLGMLISSPANRLLSLLVS